MSDDAPISGTSPQEDRRKVRRRSNTVLLVSLGLIVVVVVTAYLWLTQETNSLFVLTFINLNILATLALLTVITRNLVKIYLQRSKRFRYKLVGAFVMTSIVPVIILGILGAGILNENVNRWFNPKLEEVLTGAKAILDEFVAQERESLESVASTVAGNLPQDLEGQSLPESIRETIALGRVDLVQILNTDLEILHQEERTDDHVTIVDLETLRVPIASARSEGEPSFDIIEDEDISRLIVVAPILRDQTIPYTRENLRGFVVCHRLLTGALYSRLQTISSTHSDYAKASMSKGQIMGIYSGIFVTIGLALIFFAIWFGMNLAKEIATPVQTLADATGSVAAGNFDVHVSVRTDTEFQSLVKSFNTMTGHLRQQRNEIEVAQEELIQKNIELSEKRLYIETLLEYIPSGVISLDEELHVATMNPTASELLGLESRACVGCFAGDVFQGQPVDRLFFWIYQLQETGQTNLKRQLTLKHDDEQRYLDVVLTSFTEPTTGAQGYLVVLEDLSELLKAQRAAAWQEVARRIAHEIKNPLTPISLATQRLMRRSRKRNGDQDRVMEDSMKTIMEGIDVIQGLVSEFSRFARMPEANPQPGDLHEIIRSTAETYNGPYPRVEFAFELHPNMPEVSVDAEQMRRALRNIIDNGIAAMDDAGRITISSEYDPLFQIARITVADEGTGIPPEDKDKLFVPYFSTKGDKGTGLGLAIVSKIISDHNGYIRIKDNQPQGTKVIIELPTGFSVATTWRQ